MSRRSLARLAAWFLFCEDPQRRLDARAVATLAHQASLVQHVRSDPHLDRVLIADEVGLGKTVEAGLLLKSLLSLQPGLRVLYLAPARLVSNVAREFALLELGFRRWVAGGEGDAKLSDLLVIASIHRAVHEACFETFVNAPPWDVIIVDECHHLSDWAKGGGSATRKYQLVKELIEHQPPSGRLVLLSGTPHQGHQDRFENLLKLLRRPSEDVNATAGRVIFRTKDDIRDWDGNPLFPRRQVNDVQVVDLGDSHRAWLQSIHEFYAPTSSRSQPRRRAAGWRLSQALQWATSSVQAGLGYLVRQALRVGWELDKPSLVQALGALRPYRQGSVTEPTDQLYQRLLKEVQRQDEVDDIDDIEEAGDDDGWKPDHALLSSLLEEGVGLLRTAGDTKWREIHSRVLQHVGDEKVVLFAQPIETVTALASWLERLTGVRPSLIVGNQDDSERQAEVDRFLVPDGPQFLVSSRAGGEGINLQVARRLIHVDVPWNPMELEQRVGRVHRFGSKKTIVVDTVVVKNSREEDTYRVAREKLRRIAKTLVSEDRFEALFARVMALVPPAELAGLLGERPLAPFSQEESARLAEMVRQGFESWRQFNDQYGEQHAQNIRELPPGEAQWRDVEEFLLQHGRAEKVDGFQALRFRLEPGSREIVEANETAPSLKLADGGTYACGDFGGMPVFGPNGIKARTLGLNLPVVTNLLRGAAFADGVTGPALLRWPEEVVRPPWLPRSPVGLLAIARQSVRKGAATPTETEAELRFWVVREDGEPRQLSSSEAAAAARVLWRGGIRRDGDVSPGLLEAMRHAERSLALELKRPSDEDRQKRIAHAVSPLFAAVVW
jgi:superfamily II DNA or RNA helicase